MKISSLHKNKSAPLWAVSLISGILLALLPVAGLAGGASFYPPVDQKAPFTPTVNALVSALTVDEKIALVHWATDPHSLGQAGYNPGVPRLGIPPRRDADALGINVTANATALPARLGLGATFDRNMVYACGQLEGNEGRALGVDLIYGPQTDLTRLPNWLRNNTTWGEDPVLNGNLATAEVEGIQSKGLMSEVKHFGFYNGQSGLQGIGTVGPPSLPTIVDDQTAHELYLKAYEYPITQAAPSSIMCSNQGFEVTSLMTTGSWASDCSLTLTTILRGEWKFSGFVLSDYAAVHSVDALLAGLDMEYGTTFFATDLPALVDPKSSTYNSLYAQALDNAVAYVIYADERFGLLTGTSGNGSGFKQSPRPKINQIKNEDAATTEQAAEEAAVLLQNVQNLLPLTSPNLSSVAIIGPTARQVMVYAGLGERARGFPNRDAINPLQMLQKLAPKGSNFTYSPGIDWIGTLVPASELPGGLTRTESDSSAKQVDSTIDYGATSDLKPGVTYIWTGTFNVPSNDTYYLYLQGSIAGGGGFPGGTPAESIKIDGATPTSFSPAVPVSTYPSGIIPTGGANTGFIATLTGGPHAVVITVAVPSTLTTPVYLRFASSQLSVTINAAASAAATAKIAVVFADDNGSAGATGLGDTVATNSPIINSLSANQDALIEAVAQANANTVVVLSTGDPVLAPWANSVKGILEMWYPGQEGGTSTARLLLGLANPGGKLPISWPASEQQTPFFNHPERLTGDGTAVYFSEGIFNGYRWYDQQGITPLFSFGHGLSYTTFEYSKLKVQSSKTGVDVTFNLKNNGSVAGSEVPQIYLGPPAKQLPEVTQYAPLKLAGFERIQLDPDQSTTVQIHLDNLELSYWSTPAQQWVLATGSRKVYVGAASDDIRLEGSASVKR